MLKFSIGVLAIVVFASGCSTTIAKDTTLGLKGPKAEVSRKF